MGRRRSSTRLTNVYFFISFKFSNHVIGIFIQNLKNKKLKTKMNKQENLLIELRTNKGLIKKLKFI